MIRKFILILCLVLLSVNSFAATYYVRQGAAGSADGSDWTNAYVTLPATLERGSTYYIADGTYTRYDFDDAESGATYIYIYKATTSEHGTETGWLSSYGDGQAHFNADPALTLSSIIDFSSGYWVFDGKTGSGSDSSSYGFKISPITPTRQINAVGMPAQNDGANQLDHITFSHTAIILQGSSYLYYQYGIISKAVLEAARATDITISNNYIANAMCNLFMIRTSNSLIDNNYFYNNWSNSAAGFHGDNVIFNNNCTDVVIKNNFFKNSYTVAIGWHKNNSGEGVNYHTGFQVYNNIISGSQGTFSAFANMDSGTPDVIWGFEFHHNTFYNLSETHAIKIGTLTDVATNHSHAYNNVFYNVNNPRLDNVGYTSGAIVHDNNGYFHCTGTINNADETSPQRDDAASDPFTSISTEDFTISDPDYLGINTGKDLAATYDTDRAGLPRDTTPTIGAYEFTGSATPDPTGTLTPSGFASEVLVREGSGTLKINITGTTLVEGAAFDALRQAVIDGLTSNKTTEQEPFGWNAVVLPSLAVTAVVRTDADTITITLPAFPTYDIKASEVLTGVLPAGIVLSNTAITLSGTAMIISVDTGPATIEGCIVIHNPDAPMAVYMINGRRVER